MKLEEEIKQSKFSSEFEKLAVNILFTYNWLNNIYSKIFKNFEITTQQFNVLRILRGQYPNTASVSLIKERMLDKMSDASRLVDRLVSKGFVERHICPNDRRKVDVIITVKGLELLSAIDREMGIIPDYFNNITEKEARLVNSILDKMRG